MKAKVFYFFLAIAVFSMAGTHSSYAKDRFQIKHTTAGSIEKHLELNDAETKVSLIAEVLQEDPALNDFSEYLLDICLNPQKYGFKSGEEGKDKEECASGTVHKTVAHEIAQGLVFNYQGKKDAVQVEKHLNDFMNNYLEKVRAVIEAFESWM
jgi:hypothetical protein